MSDAFLPEAHPGLPAAELGDIVIPASSLDSEKRAALLSALTTEGIKGYIAGVSPPRTDDQPLLTAAVAEWEARFTDGISGRHFDAAYDMNGSGQRKRVLTERTIRHAFEEDNGISNGASIANGRAYYSLVDVIHKVRGSRGYLQEGTIYLGAWKRGPGYKFEQRHYGITPEALYGLTLDREPARQLGSASLLRFQSMLRHITKPSE